MGQNVNYALSMLIKHGVDYIESSKQKALAKTELIESISGSVVLVVVN
jgi:hypothetical protein